MTQDTTIVSKPYTNEHPACPSGFWEYVCAPWSDIRFIVCVSLLFFVLLWCIHTWYGLAVCVVLAFIYAYTSKTFTRQTTVFFLPFVWYTVLSLLFNGLVFGTPDIVILGSFGFRISGIIRTAMVGSRILCMIMICTSIATRFTVLDAVICIRSLLSPFRFLHIPVDHIELIMSMTLCSFPPVMREVRMLMISQQIRGVAFHNVSLKKRLNAWISVFVPLVIRFFRMSTLQALSMKEHGYNGQARRLPQPLARGAWACNLCVFVIGCVILMVF